MTTRSLLRRTEHFLPLFRSTVNATTTFTHQKRYYNPVHDHLEKQNSLPLPLNEDAWTPGKPGLEQATNWSLAPHHIHPQFDAYRNADIDNLLRTAPYGRVDGTQHLIADEYKTTFDRFVSHRSQPDKYSQLLDLPIRYQRRVQRELAFHLSYASNVFVHDGSVGAHRDTNAPIRVVTDNSVSALFLRNLLSPVAHVSAHKFQPSSLILHAPGYRLTPDHVVEEFAGPSKEDLGINKDEFLIVNERDNQVLMGGISDTDVLLETLAYVAGRVAWQKNALLLPSDSFIANGQVTLVIHNGNTLASLQDNTVYGAHHNIWSEEGLSRAWNGVRVKLNSLDGVNVRKCDLVEKVGKGFRLTRKHSRKQGDAVLPNLVNHPKNVVLAIHDPNALVPSVAQVTAEQLKNLYSAGLSALTKDKPTFSQALVESQNFAPYANALQLAERLQGLLSKSGANLYVINSANDAKDVASVLKAIQSGSKLSTNDKKKSKLWTGLSHDQVRERDWKDEGKYSTSLSELEKRVSEQVSKLPKVEIAQQQ